MKELSNNFLSPAKRLLQFIDNQGITKYEFHKKIGVSNGFLDKAKEIRSDNIRKILDNYPIISPIWLLTGKGEMLLDNENIVSESNTPYIAKRGDNNSEGIPLIPIDAMAGVARGEISVLELDCDRYVVPAFKGADYLITVKGFSMHPKYSSGDIIACKKVPLQDIFFQWNKVYVLDTIQGVLIKRVKEHKNKAYILCVSDNKDYEPFEICKDQIYAIAIVLGVIRLE